MDDTCYRVSLLPEDACASFKETLDSRCDFISVEVGD